MQATYYPDDDILELKFGDKPIAREISQNWNVNISYDAEGNIVEMVILEARESGLYPVHTVETKAAYQTYSSGLSGCSSLKSGCSLRW